MKQKEIDKAIACGEVLRYRFGSYAKLEKFFLENMKKLAYFRLSSKVIGKTILIFKKEA